MEMKSRQNRLNPTALGRALLLLALLVGMSMVPGVTRTGHSLNYDDSTDQTVKITPLGSHAGEFCRNDRALLFEDPTGVRVLYDPGRTLDGGADPRLGDVHVLILSSVHSDHIGERRQGTAACGANANGAVFPQSNAADIARIKNSAVLVGGEMADFLSQKITNLGGAPVGCPAAGLTNETLVPRVTPCTATLRPGGSRTVRLISASQGVKFANIPAFHSNGIPPALVDPPGVAPGTTGYGGNDGGYIVRFTNGLTVYLTADTGLSGDMETIVRKFYEANLVVINMGDTASLGPDEAAFAVNKLIKPRTVIPSHINEAATTGGVPTGARLNRFIGEVKSGIDVVVPRSGVTLLVNGHGRCVNCP